MKHSSLLTSAFALAVLLASCGKTGVSTPPLATCEPGTEITFSTKGLDFSIESKATVVTEVPTFNVIAATGAAGSQSDYWGGSVTATQSGVSWLTGKYWEITDPGITSFYASNAALTFNAAGPTVTLANCNTDVVAAHCDSPSYASSNDLTFNHVLTRLGSITLNTQSGYELSAVSATLTDGCTAGTYNLRTGAWSSLGARSAVAAGDFSGSTSAQTSANDKWFVPGSYTFSVSYTLTKGDYVQSFTKTGTVTLLAGKKNNLTATAVGGSAQEIVFNVSVTDWSLNPVDLDWDNSINPHPFTVNASGDVVYFTRADLMYDGTAESGHEWHLMNEPWSTLTMDATLTSSSQIDVFIPGQSGYKGSNPWNSSSKLSDEGIFNADWNTNSPEWDFGKHNTIYNSNAVIELSSLRCMTLDEANYVINNRRDHITGATIAGIKGTLLLSDDYVHPTGLAALNMLTRIDASYTGYAANVFTEEEFREMESNGAVFLRELITSYCNDPSPYVQCFIIDWSYNAVDGDIYPNTTFPVSPIYNTRKARIRLIQDPS